MNYNTSLRIFIIALLLALPWQVSSANTAENTQAEEAITLSLDNADVRDLLRWASRYIDKNLIIHPSVQGKISVISRQTFKPSDVPQMLTAILEVYGYVLLESDEHIKVIPAKQSNASPFPIDTELSKHHDEDVVVQLVKLSNVPASQVVDVIRPLMPQEAYVNAYSEANMIVLSDRVANIERTLTIIAQIDQAGLIDIEVIGLAFADANEVFRAINEILPTSLKRKNEAGLGVTLSVDERSNSLLMTGDPVVRSQIKKLISRLDKPLDSQVVTTVLRLNYARAENLTKILKSVKGGVEKTAQDKNFSDSDVHIEVDKATNSLIITAPRALLKTMRDVITRIDVRRPQVLVEAVIVEVNDEIARDLGIRWTNTVPSDNGIFTGLSSIPDKLTTATPPALGSGLTLGFYSSGELRGIVRALENDSASNVLSTPTIVALDNEEAEILVGENVPFITGSSTSSSSTTDNPFQTIKRQDIGVTLKVRPQINNDNSITLNIEQTTESIALSTANTADIVTSKRNLKTTVLIEDDEVLVLGGLIRDEVSEKQNKVPLLGDIPLLGRLFRSSSTQNIKKNLMAFIHPKILRERSDNALVSLDQYSRMKSLQQSFNQNIDHILIPGKPPLLEKNIEPQQPPKEHTSPKENRNE